MPFLAKPFGYSYRHVDRVSSGHLQNGFHPVDVLRNVEPGRGDLGRRVLISIMPQSIRGGRLKAISASPPRSAVEELQAEMHKLRAENRDLKRANEILKSASVFFVSMPS